MAENERTEHEPRTQRTSVPDRTVDLVDRTANLSDEVLTSVEAGQRAAIAAVRKFVDTVDEALARFGRGPVAP